MTTAKCVCGFNEGEAGDETIGDHLLEVFAPEDGKGTDGRVHLEGEPNLACFCGLAVATAGELDAHFITLFTPGDAIGRDGKKHRPVTTSANGASKFLLRCVQNHPRYWHVKAEFGGTLPLEAYFKGVGDAACVRSYPGLIWPERDPDFAGPLVCFFTCGAVGCKTTAVTCNQQTAVAGPLANRH
jgi:hypothetical protein